MLVAESKRMHVTRWLISIFQTKIEEENFEYMKYNKFKYMKRSLN